jgi:hypothetical protein
VDILGIGFIGAGFSARFHLRGLVGVRGAEVVAVYSRTERVLRSSQPLSEEPGLGGLEYIGISIRCSQILGSTRFG